MTIKFIHIRESGDFERVINLDQILFAHKHGDCVLIHFAADTPTTIVGEAAEEFWKFLMGNAPTIYSSLADEITDLAWDLTAKDAKDHEKIQGDAHHPGT